MREYQENLEHSWNYCLVLSPPPKMAILSVLAKISRKIEIELFRSYLTFRLKTRVSLKYLVNDCILKHLFASNLRQTLPKQIFLKAFITLRPLTQF